MATETQSHGEKLATNFTVQQKRLNETTDEHRARQPQAKVWSTVLFGVRQLAAAFARVELLRLGKGASKLAHSKEDGPQECWKNPCQIAKDFRLCSTHLCSSVVSFCAVYADGE
ncbi:MAG: hypothetical protein DMG09_30615 [Acidobacteria bacterium]|nr:MAG: hypothetical protein DMG09_30615 [Acidobacteriota bacterium]